MNLRTPLALVLLAVPALAFTQDTHVTHIQSATGPITVTWGQPATLAKANEYQVQISDFDRNGDGRLTRSEIPADHALQYEFHVVDRNNDRYLSAEELAPWR